MRLLEELLLFRTTLSFGHLSFLCFSGARTFVSEPGILQLGQPLLRGPQASLAGLPAVLAQPGALTALWWRCR
jgi:hypothetical protein